MRNLKMPMLFSAITSVIFAILFTLLGRIYKDDIAEISTILVIAGTLSLYVSTFVSGLSFCILPLGYSENEDKITEGWKITITSLLLVTNGITLAGSALFSLGIFDIFY